MSNFNICIGSKLRWNKPEDAKKKRIAPIVRVLCFGLGMFCIIYQMYIKRITGKRGG